MATLTLRLDDGLKASASEVAGYYGFDLGSVTRAFYTQMVRDRAIPLDLGSCEPNAESRRAIAETDAMLANGGYETYGDAASLLAAARADS